MAGDAVTTEPANAPITEPEVARHAPTFHRLRVREVRELTDDAVEIGFAVPADLREAFAHRHGQHLTVRLHAQGAPDTADASDLRTDVADGETLDDGRRSYSITSPLGDDDILRIGVRRVPEGRVSSHLASAVQVGDALEVMTPAGRFTAEVVPTATRHWLFVAAGSGITPIMSIVRTVLAREPLSRVTVLYGNRTARSIMFFDELEDLKDEHVSRMVLLHFLSREHRAVDLLDGRLDGTRLTRTLTTAVDGASVDLAFVCGPEEMALEAREVLLGIGLASDAIHLELFGTASGSARTAVADDADVVATARILINGLESDVPIRTGEHVLDAALRAGLDVPYACTGGVCSTCRAHVSGGEVEMDVNYALEPDEVARGYRLTCQSVPTTDRVFVDFDRP